MQASRLILSGALMTVSAWSFAAQSYVVHDLGTLGGSYSFASGINDAAQVVGSAGVCCTSETYGFVWDAGAATALQDPSIWHSEALAINATGQVAGFAYPIVEAGTSRAQAFIYTNGVRQDLGTLGGHSSEAYGINALGVATGWSLSSDGAQHAFVFDGLMTDLGTLGGASSGGAGINDHGHVTGWALTVSGEQHAFVSDEAGMHDLGTLGGHTSYGQAINNAGHVAGWSTLGPDLLAHAALFDGTAWKDLGTLGGEQSYGLGVNGSDQVVGFSMDTREEQRAFIYTGGVMFNLNDISDAKQKGWTLAVASGINTRGDIAGSGLINGQLHAFLLTSVQEPPISSVPEPETYVMLLLGLGAVASMSSRAKSFARTHRDPAP